jgi:hypothetical protein
MPDTAPSHAAGLTDDQIDRVVCENSAYGLCGLAVVELEHAAKPLTAP